MKQVPNDHEIIITDDKDLFVEVNYRCFFEPNKCFAPMCVSGSIYNGHTLQDLLNKEKKITKMKKKRMAHLNG